MVNSHLILILHWRTMYRTYVNQDRSAVSNKQTICILHTCYYAKAFYARYILHTRQCTLHTTHYTITGLLRCVVLYCLCGVFIFHQHFQYERRAYQLIYICQKYSASHLSNATFIWFILLVSVFAYASSANLWYSISGTYKLKTFSTKCIRVVCQWLVLS